MAWTFEPARQTWYDQTGSYHDSRIGAAPTPNALDRAGWGNSISGLGDAGREVVSFYAGPSHYGMGDVDASAVRPDGSGGAGGSIPRTPTQDEARQAMLAVACAPLNPESIAARAMGCPGPSFLDKYGSWLIGGAAAAAIVGAAYMLTRGKRRRRR